MGGEYLLCICDEEWCYCTQWVYRDDIAAENDGPFPPEIACPLCKAGNHVMDAPG